MKTANFIKTALCLLFTFLFVNSSYSAVIADISFENPNWEFSNGVTYDAASGELTITGDDSEYRYARIIVTLPNTPTELYFSGEIFLENILLGVQAYHAPKLKIYSGSSSLLAKNFSSPAQGSWYRDYINYSISNENPITLEFGFQNSSGKYVIKAPQLEDTAPVPTPYTFPFSYSGSTNCNLDLSSSNLRAFNNDLLSTNSHFSWASESWSDSEIIQTTNDYYPMTNFRFPGGTVGNFYDWTTDGYHNDPSTFDNASRQNLYNNNFRFDYTGYKDQVLSSNGSATLMFNVIHDDITTAANRLQSRINDGLNVKWVELGNETFYNHQSYGFASGGQWQVSDVNEYINHTSALTSSLKAISPSTKYAVCLNHHDYTSGSWSDVLSNETYYDATTIHNYNSLGTPDLDFSSGVILYDSYVKTRHNIKEYIEHFGNTPTIITEWGVIGSQSFLGVLSSADMFMALLEGDLQDGVVKQAGIHMFYHSDQNVSQSLIMLDGGQIKHTPMGVYYSKLYSVFKDREIYTNLSSSLQLKDGLPSVISKAVDLGDSIRVFSINKLPEPSTLNISLDGESLEGAYTMETYSMDPADWPEAQINPNLPWTKSNGSSIISLPAYSLTVTTIAKNVVTSLETKKSSNSVHAFPNPVSKTVFLSGIKNGEQFAIYDIQGKNIKQGFYNSKGIDLTNISPGSYLLKTSNNHLKLIVK